MGNVRCFVTLEQNIEQSLVSNKLSISSSNQIRTTPSNPTTGEEEMKRMMKELKQCAAVHSFNEKFDCFMDSLKCEWSQLFMMEIQKMINKGQLNRHRKVPKEV